MVSFLMQKAHEDATLLSKEHVEWVMQITGHAFSLTINESVNRILDNATQIYERCKKKYNKALQKKKKKRKMCGHLSFVFKTRDITPENPMFAKHVELCRRVLSIYSRSARSPPKAVDITKWNEFLCRVFLGICSEVMKMTGERAALGNQIEQDLFFCLFDIWIRAQIQNNELWEKLSKLVRSGDWVYRQWFIEGWGLSCTALARRLTYMLYGGDNGSSVVEIYWPLIGSQSRSVDYSLRGSQLINTHHKRLNVTTPTGAINATGVHFVSGPTSPTAHVDNDKDERMFHSPASPTGGGSGGGNDAYHQKTYRFGQSELNVISEHKTDKQDNESRFDSESSPRATVASKKQQQLVEVAYMQGQGSVFGQSQSSVSNLHSTTGGDVLAMVTAVDVTEPKLVIYLWNEMLSVLDINSVSDPDCFAIAVAWVSYMVDMFSNVTVTINQRRSGLLPPDGNTVLQIFGNKLFTASLKVSGFEAAHAISLGGLCRVFCGRPFTEFQDKYLLNFYHTVESFLKNTQDIKEARKQVIMHGASLFACGFAGARSLVDVFLYHIRAIFQSQTKDARLRSCAITMLASFVCLEWHFWPSDAVIYLFF
ncbi:rap/ran GTPase-activating protein [Reticulomyxa filosa]|uniref:Rap/ran GTPase-activating protein n=1 Tax=Reticulomyxa filosa TaxID=46433 RepID=X6NQX8_RETFI|nr:rap/ran GTPase-activating protein [Reticulomyxa filosa]|eukprot:ETO27762.1 rap/ran GTPase-activating protein [Reticulomyxa filosa]